MQGPRRRRIDEFLGEGCDPDEVARLAAEKAVALLAKGILEELREIRERLDRLEEEVRRGRGQRRRGGGLVERVREALERDRYILGSQARGKVGVSPQALYGVASGMDGVRIIDAGGDFIVFDSMGFDEFRALLSTIQTSDPEEAARRLGPFGDAFNALRRAGSVYFDGRERRWRIVV
ncbi:MAG: hypothetical protein F7B18_05185 [Desulfurococcales archaeon]|nr:hypothetical protein [Desulfurococcales archaeon]